MVRTVPDDGTGRLLTWCLVGILCIAVTVVWKLIERHEEREAAARREDMRRRVPRLTTYDTEEIHRNCTVVVWLDTESGETITQWWENREGDETDG